MKTVIVHCIKFAVTALYSLERKYIVPRVNLKFTKYYRIGKNEGTFMHI